MSDSSQTTLVTLYVFDSQKKRLIRVIRSRVGLHWLCCTFHSVDSIAVLRGLIAGNSVRVGYLIGIGSVHIGRRMHVRNGDATRRHLVMLFFF